MTASIYRLFDIVNSTFPCLQLNYFFSIKGISHKAGFLAQPAKKVVAASFCVSLSSKNVSREVILLYMKGGQLLRSQDNFKVIFFRLKCSLCN